MNARYPSSPLWTNRFKTARSQCSCMQILVIYMQIHVICMQIHICMQILHVCTSMVHACKLMLFSLFAWCFVDRYMYIFGECLTCAGCANINLLRVGSVLFTIIPTRIVATKAATNSQKVNKQKS